MSRLSKEIGKSKEDQNVSVVDLESLSDIVESELDNVAAGGYVQCNPGGPTHTKTVTEEQ